MHKEAKGLPESYKLWIKTFGCSHNMSDGEYMEVFPRWAPDMSSDIGHPRQLWLSLRRKPGRR